MVLSQQWKAAIDYVLRAWKYVDEMPDWDNPSHNSSKEQCFKSLAVQCKTSLQKSAFTKDEYIDIQRRYEIFPRHLFLSIISLWHMAQKD